MASNKVNGIEDPSIVSRKCLTINNNNNYTNYNSSTRDMAKSIVELR